MIDIIIYQSHSWTLDRFACDQTKINNLGRYADTPTGGTGAGASISCQPITPSCPGTGFSTISDYTYCTDFSIAVQISSGALIKKMSLSRSTNIVIGFQGVAWAGEIKKSSGAGASSWFVVTRIDLTQKYPINTSPGILSTNTKN